MVAFLGQNARFIVWDLGKIHKVFAGVYGFTLIILCGQFKTCSYEPSSKWKSIHRIYFLVYQELIQLHWLDSIIWGTNKGAKGFHAFHWCICGCPWLSMVWYTNYPPFLCHSVLQLHLLSRVLATDSLACSIHYFSFVSNAAVLWILAPLCFIPDLVTCVDFSRPVQYSCFSVCKLRLEFFMHLL